AAGGLAVGEERRVRAVDVVDRVVDRGVDDGRCAGEVHAREAVGLDGVQNNLIPLGDNVRRRQAAVVQRFEPRAEPGPAAGRTGLGTRGGGPQGGQDRAERHGTVPFVRGLRYDGNDTSAGAQTGRRGGAGPAGGLLGGKDPTGRFAFWS